MATPRETFLLGCETHSPAKLNEAFAAGLEPAAWLDGKPLLVWLTEMYLRSPAFAECVRCLVDAGVPATDAGLLAVLRDDAELIHAEYQRDAALVRRRVDLRCAFTPLAGASLLHVAAEFGLRTAAATLLELGADVEARAAIDGDGFNGHTPIFHTVCQHRNHGRPVLELLLAHGARTDVTVPGITWGKGFEWATVLFDVTPLTYAQAGLLPQFQRAERDVYDNIRLLAAAARRRVPADLNVPNAYLARHARPSGQG